MLDEAYCFIQMRKPKQHTHTNREYY